MNRPPIGCIETRHGRRRSAGMKERAHSLMEIVCVIAIAALLLAIAGPTLNDMDRDARFAGFSSALVGNLTAARRYARESGLNAELRWRAAEGAGASQTLYDVRVQTLSGEWRTLAAVESGGRIGKRILAEPERGFPHPTGGAAIDRSLRSTHRSRILFGARGASAATLTVTDRDDRAVCIVVSPATGRLRSYLWSPRYGQWRAFE